MKVYSAEEYWFYDDCWEFELLELFKSEESARKYIEFLIEKRNLKDIKRGSNNVTGRTQYESLVKYTIECREVND